MVNECEDDVFLSFWCEAFNGSADRHDDHFMNESLEEGAPHSNGAIGLPSFPYLIPTIQPDIKPTFDAHKSSITVS